MWAVQDCTKISSLTPAVMFYKKAEVCECKVLFFLKLFGETCWMCRKSIGGLMSSLMSAQELLRLLRLLDRKEDHLIN